MANLSFLINSKKARSMVYSTVKISHYHQLYGDGILEINCHNQKVEILEQYKLLDVLIDEHFEL